MEGYGRERCSARELRDAGGHTRVSNAMCRRACTGVCSAESAMVSGGYGGFSSGGGSTGTTAALRYARGASAWHRS